MDPLDKARAIRMLVSDYKKAHPGTDDLQARTKLGIPAKNTPALKKWAPPAEWTAKHGGKAMATKKRASGESIVCDDSGMGVSTRTGARLHASYGGHTKVEFDGPALGASLQGFLEWLRYGTSMDVVKMYPNMYPQYVQAAAMNKQFCAEREIGAEMAQRLGSALRVFNISPAEWANFYVQAIANAPPLPRQMLGAGALDGQAQQLGPGSFGPPMLGPLVITSPFAAQR